MGISEIGTLGSPGSVDPTRILRSHQDRRSRPARQSLPGFMV